ncbi:MULTISPECIES: allantoate permease family MFS transporter [Novosphingobium]|uniref:Sulfatase-modifying factor protein n=1 Tax=Novosphingobium mangrovi (ex Hu et al. 2023) TaxID=2930094 RepID=A0ABT0AH39_9SPHN|nr:MULTISPECIES: allantoate permease family MFS transporter [Novosphingobium]MCJ1962514.1 hypothetical protein [Novosphingobium mangrovi (ex Hu et al. 2023)]TYC81607.1 allantoate permease family MFS transporter [Novosphingobium sp. BW1]
MMDIPWDQPATLIDLDGKTPVIGSFLECVMHFSLFKPFAKEQARILLTRPVFKPGRKTRAWILNPDEIELIVERLNRERAEGKDLPPHPGG